MKETVRYILAMLFLVVVMAANKQCAYREGFERGEKVTLDTVQKILDVQSTKHTSTCTMITFNDTIWYNLSNLKCR